MHTSVLTCIHLSLDDQSYNTINKLQASDAAQNVEVYFTAGHFESINYKECQL